MVSLSPKLGKLIMEGERKKLIILDFVMVFLITITALFPAVVQISVDDPVVGGFNDMFIVGLIMSVFFFFVMFTMSTRKGKQEVAMNPILLTSKTISDNLAAVFIAIVGGLIVVIINGMIGLSGNLILGSAAVGGDQMVNFYIGLLAGVAETLFFIGFLQTFFRLAIPSPLVIIPAAAMFTIFHYNAGLPLLGVVAIFAIGLIFSGLYEFTGRLSVPALAHVINNTYAMLPLVLAVFISGGAFLVILIGLFVFVFSIVIASFMTETGGKRRGTQKKGRKPRNQRKK